MDYGLIGEKLAHSFSKEIHESFAEYKYTLKELSPNEFDEFMTARGFKAINVTIPYKQTVIPYLDCIDSAAKDIGAVNTVINRNGRLYGYNTDFYGLRSLINRTSESFEGATVLILGSGGTSKTAYAVAKSMGAEEIVRVGRKNGNGVISYEQATEFYSDADYIINTTPCGMYPNQNGSESVPALPISISSFSKLKGVFDAVYNPLRTNLVLDASDRGIPAEGGLYMLVSQAIRASELFCGTEYDESLKDRVFAKLRQKKENLILIGMPGCGKSTVGKALAEKLGREFIDTDEVIKNRCGLTIPEIFARYGENGFRDEESAAIRDITSNTTGAVIATGGGAILRDNNVRMLKRCGTVFFINRPLKEIVPTADRPLSSDRKALENRFNERYPKYISCCDFEIKTDDYIDHTVNIITDIFNTLG